MKPPKLILYILVLLLLMGKMHASGAPGSPSQPPLAAPASLAGSPTQAPAPTAANIQDLQDLPLVFIENQGQLDDQVAYYLPGAETQVYFTPGGVTFALTGTISRSQQAAERQVYSRSLAGSAHSQPIGVQRWVVRLDFVGANPQAQLAGADRAPTTVSYFKGQPGDWHTSLPTYRRVVYHNLWEGIDLVYHGEAGRLKYDFIVQPGADPAQVQLAYRGATGVVVNEQGQMEVRTPLGSFSDDTPTAYQESEAGRVEVDLEYALSGGEETEAERRFSFRLGRYDPSLPLVLDPVILVYCGFIGGEDYDYGRGIAVDSAGNAYIAGESQSTEATFPVKIGPDLTFNAGRDAIVVKVAADGLSLLYAGYIGGIYSEYVGNIAVDSAGNAYITGDTTSTETSFPVKGGPDLIHNGNEDIFIAKVAADGSSLIYAGYIGGSYGDLDSTLAVDGTGSVYVTGYTFSNENDGFPVKGGPDLIHNGSEDIFIAKVTADGSSLIYAGFIGGIDSEYGGNIAVDNAGNAYIAGHTESTDASFPVKGGPGLTYHGNYDAFVAKVAADGKSLVYAGYIGGTGYEASAGIAVDSAGNAYLTGSTASSEASFPVKGGPDLTFNGSNDAFVAKVAADGFSLIYAGYIGGIDSEYGGSIAVDSAGNAYITGGSSSTESSFPVNDGPDLTFNGGYNDAFVAKVAANGKSLLFAGYIGGTDYDYGRGIIVDEANNVYFTGETYSTESSFPLAIGPDFTHNGRSDAFIAKIVQKAIQIFVPLMGQTYTWDQFYESNNTWLNSYGPLVSGTTYLAYPNDLEDYYYFNISTSARVTIQVSDYSPTSSSGDLYLYGPASGAERGDLVGYFGTTGKTTLVIGPYNLQAGKYYVRVYTASNYSTSKLYRLSITVE